MESEIKSANNAENYPKISEYELADFRDVIGISALGLNNKAEYDFALIFGISDVKLMPFEQFSLLEKESLNSTLNNIVEARFFNQQKELRLFDYNGTVRAVLIEDTKALPKGSKIKRNLYPGFGYKSIEVAEYIDFDDDGQAYVRLTRLCGATVNEG